MVPECNFAIVSLSNACPNGIPFNKTVVRWALETYLGVVDRDPEALPYDGARARDIVGSYEIKGAQYLNINTDGKVLTLEVGTLPEIRAAFRSEVPPGYAPAEIGLLPADGDEYILTDTWRN